MSQTDDSATIYSDDGHEVTFIKENNTLIGLGDLFSYDSLGDSILNTFTSRPRFVGQINAETGEELTFDQMRRKSVRLALFLHTLGITKSSVITICTRNHMLVYLPLLAGIFLSSIVNVWDAEYLNDNIRFIYFLLETNPDVIFVDEENYLRIDAAIAFINNQGKQFSTRIIMLDRQCGEHVTLDLILNSTFEDPTLKKAFGDSAVDKFVCTRNKGTDAAIMIYSCNASGYPGHAQIPYQAFQSPSNDHTPVMKFGDIGLWYGPINWTHNLLLTIRAILKGVTVIKSSRDYSEENLCQIVDKYKVKWVFLESNMFNKLSTIKNFQVIKKYDVSSLETVLIGDAEVRWDFYQEIMRYLSNASIIKVYALSETGVIAYRRNSSTIYNNTVQSSGYVSQNVELMIVSLVTREKLRENIAGEIWCKTPCIIQTSNSTMWRFSEKDKERINKGWYYTEDVGYFDEYGNVYVIGNSRDVIKYRNVIISLIQIEEALKLHPAVSDAAAAGVRVYHPDLNYVKGYVVKKLGAEVTKRELIEFVKETLIDESYVLHAGLDFVEKIPYLPNGKVDRVKILTIPPVPDNKFI